MNEFSVIDYGFEIFQIILLIILAPLLVGIMRKIKAKSQKRFGASVFQPYYDLVKLFHKEEVISEQSSWIFRVTPWINFIVITSCVFFIPISIVYSPFGIIGDVLLVIGLFSLAKFFTMLAGLDVASSFGGLGSSREMMLSSLIEPALFITLFVIASFYGGTNISTIVTSASETSLLVEPGIVFAIIALFILIMAETGRLPFDNPATHLELTMIHEAMVLEYSGKSLALMEWSQSIKQLILFTLFVNVFFPLGIASHLSITSVSIGLFAFVAKIMSLGMFVAFLETRVAKWRLFRVPDLIAISISSSMIGIVFFFL